MTQTERATLLDELFMLIAETNVLREKLRERTMIYQVDLKEEAALAFRRPLNHFYDWPYYRWERVRTAFLRKQTRVKEECLAAGMPRNKPWIDFPLYRARMGYPPS